MVDVDGIAFSFGTEDELLADPSELNLQVEGEEYDFTLEQAAEAAQIVHLPAGLRLMYLYKKNGGGAKAEVPVAQWGPNDWAAFGAVVSTLGSKRAKSEPVGELKFEYNALLESASVEAIKASLINEKAATVSILTDATLVTRLIEARGAVVGEDAAYRQASIQFPGCGFKVVCGASGWKRGRVILHGGDFVNWYNKSYNERVVYREICTEAVRMAAIFQVLYRVDSAKDDKLIIMDQTIDYNNPILKAYGRPSPHFRSVGLKVKNLMEQGYRRVANRQPAGMGLKSAAYYEYLLDRVVADMPEASVINLRAALEKIDTAEKQRWDQFTMTNGTVFGKPEEKDMGRLWRSFANGECNAPGMEGTVKTKGGALKFVEDSRKFIRDHNDLMRKSDALTTGFLGTYVSVPIKTGTAITYLKSMNGMTEKDKFHEVDAWGLHTVNLWHHQVVDNSEIVHWRDKDKASRVPLAADEIIISDIEAVVAGSKAGLYCFDDTWNAKTESLPMNPDAKVKAVATSGYEGGFLKMYYGSGAEAISPIGAVSPHMETMLLQYEQVALAPGGSPHSPEYYLVFNKPRVRSDGAGTRRVVYNWVPPKRVGNDPYPVPGNEFTAKASPDEPDDFHKARIMSYFKTWCVIFGFEMVRMNVLINYDVLSASRRERTLLHMCKPAHLGNIKLAGVGPVSSRLREEVIEVAPINDADYDF